MFLKTKDDYNYSNSWAYTMITEKRYVSKSAEDYMYRSAMPEQCCSLLKCNTTL